MAAEKPVSANAGTDPMIVDIKDSISESVESARKILDRAELRSKTPIPVVGDTRRTVVYEPVVETPYQPVRHTGGRITTPAGPPPVKPQGFKKDWPDGPASDEVVRAWAQAVYNQGGGRFAPEAVVYWVRYFWDINSPGYKRVKELVLAALARYDG